MQQIAEVSSGYTFRGQIENDPTGGIFVLQAKNLSVNQDVTNVSDFIKVSDQNIRSPYFLEYNDVLLVSRGSGHGSFRSAVFVSNQANVMPSSSVLVVRVKDVNVLPKYISLYLNSEAGQKEILGIVTGGSYIQSVLVKNLSDLPISIPPIHIQKSIIELHENIQQQERIIQRKSELKKNIINSTFTNLIK